LSQIQVKSKNKQTYSKQHLFAVLWQQEINCIKIYSDFAFLFH